MRDGVPLVSKGKAQKRPLDMLKALVALGGRNVDASMLTAQLWPDAEGDDAKTSFDSGLYRLRKLLGVDGALTLAEGKLSLNPQRRLARRVGVRAGARCDAARRRGGARAAIAVISSASKRPRHGRCRCATGCRRGSRAPCWPRAGARSAARLRAARALYERALELDNLAEAVYRRLMVCQRELGDPAGALTTYRRCRELLSIVLGRKPAAETEAIRARLAASS